MIEEKLKNLKKINLSKSEKNQMRSKLFEYMESHPVRAQQNDRHIFQKSNMFAFITNFRERRYAMPALILAMVVALSGGTAFAADASLPGDTLYPVKVGINERVRSAFAFSDEAEAELDIYLAEKRLQEFEKLAIKGRLKTDVAVMLEENFVKFEERVENRIEGFRREGRDDLAARIASRLEVAINAHAQVLDILSAHENSEIKTNLDSVLEKLRVKAETTERLRGEAEIDASADIQKKNDGEAVIARVKMVAESKAAQATSLLVRAETSLDVEVFSRLEAKLQLAQELMVEAETKIEAKLYSEALRLYYRAITLTEETVQSIRAHKDFKVDLRFDNRVDAQLQREGQAESEIEFDVNSDLEGDSLEVDTTLENRSTIELRLQN